MKLEADIAGIYHSELWDRDYPKLQILTIRELLEEGKKPSLPPFLLPTYQQAEAVSRAAGRQEELFGGQGASDRRSRLSDNPQRGTRPDE